MQPGRDDVDGGQEMSLFPCSPGPERPEETLSCHVEVRVCVHGSPQGICLWAFFQGGAATLGLLTQALTLEIWKFHNLRAGEGLPNPEMGEELN